MRKEYITIAIISVVMVVASGYGFIQTGSPQQTRDLSLDQTKIKNISDIKSTIDIYFSKNKMLPPALNDLVVDYPYLNAKIKDPETGSILEYLPNTKTSYKLCALFAYSSAEAQKKASDDYSSYSYLYSDQQLNHSRGRHCFNFSVSGFIPSPSPKPNPSVFVPPVSESTRIPDEYISQVTTAMDTTYTQFNPVAFFTTIEHEAGLINKNRGVASVTVIFKEPVKIASITNIFNYCPQINCYRWKADATLANGKEIILVDYTDSAIDVNIDTNRIGSFQKIENNDAISKITITVQDRIGSSVVWKKIKFAYR